MIEEQFYLSDPNMVNHALFLTDLSIDEIEAIVGRFSKRSSRAGQLRGEIVVMVDGSVIIRHHFNKKVLWRT